MAETGTSESYYDPASRSAQLKRIMESLDMLCSMVTRELCNAAAAARRDPYQQLPSDEPDLQLTQQPIRDPVIIAAAAVVIPLYFIAIKLIQHSTTTAENLTTAPAGGERRYDEYGSDGSKTCKSLPRPKPDSRTPALNKSQTFGVDRIYDGDLEGWFVYDPLDNLVPGSFSERAKLNTKCRSRLSTVLSICLLSAYNTLDASFDFIYLRQQAHRPFRSHARLPVKQRFRLRTSRSCQQILCGLEPICRPSEKRSGQNLSEGMHRMMSQLRPNTPRGPYTPTPRHGAALTEPELGAQRYNGAGRSIYNHSF
ncbi:hypothetical protein B0H14DRAFT_3441004 [Mycena olivaceomarginata]|nr:hypothetical protein B0H14DRAFT_3441004 [Mycena olivaceomarginata]